MQVWLKIGGEGKLPSKVEENLLLKDATVS